MFTAHNKTLYENHTILNLTLKVVNLAPQASINTPTINSINTIHLIGIQQVGNGM